MRKPNAQRQEEIKAAKARRLTALQAAREHVKRGTCPQCGCGLRRNLSMTGWYQCNALGAVGFQTGDGIGKPPCNFQFFYDPSDQERQTLLDMEMNPLRLADSYKDGH